MLCANTTKKVYCSCVLWEIRVSGIFLLGAFERLQKWIVLLVGFLLVVKVKHFVLLDGDHLSIVYISVIVCIKNSHQFLQLLSCHRNASFLHTVHELCPGDLFTVVFVQLTEEVHYTESPQFYVLQQQVQNILRQTKKCIGLSVYCE